MANEYLPHIDKKKEKGKKVIHYIRVVEGPINHKSSVNTVVKFTIIKLQIHSTTNLKKTQITKCQTQMDNYLFS